jgi:hypothetical protein
MPEQTKNELTVTVMPEQTKNELTFTVMIKCDDYCENWEAPRKLASGIDLKDPIRAIREALCGRDRLHETWIVINEENEA